MNRSLHALRGFTLLELIIALAVFALMSAMAYSGLQSVLETRQHVELQAEQLKHVQIAWATVERDITQAIGRRLRDGNGDLLPVLRGGNNILEFSRIGWNNPNQRPRSAIQHVLWHWENEKLKRSTWLVLDQSPTSLPQDAVVLADVKAFELRFMDEQRQWQLLWPSGGENEDRLPRAIEVTLDIPGWGRISRLFKLAESITL